MRRRISLPALCLALASATALAGANATPTVNERYPGLASGVLAYARLANLPTGILLRCQKTVVTDRDIEKTIAEAPRALRAQLRKSATFVLEHLATPKLLATLARQEPGADNHKSDEELVRAYLDAATANVTVSDDEIAQFYKENSHLLGGASLQDVREPIRQHLLGKKKQQAVDQLLLTLGHRLTIEVSETWLDQHAPSTLDNPLDKARRSGKPTVVAFSDPCG